METLKDYSHQDLTGQDFSEVDLTGADLSHAILCDANFAVARLQDANLAYADMTGVNLGKTLPFRAVAFSPDGQLMATGSDGPDVQLWNLDSGYLVRAFQGHTGAVNSVAFSHDGKTLASGSSDKSIRLWNVESGEILHMLDQHKDIVTCVAFSPDGQLLASGDKDRILYVWDTRDGSVIWRMQGHTDEIECIAFDATGRFLASGGRDKRVRYWSMADGQEQWAMGGVPDTVRSLAFSASKPLLYALSNDFCAIRTDTRKVEQWLPGHIGVVNSVAFSPDGQMLASGSDDGTVRLWDVAGRRQLRALQGHTEEVKSVAFSPDGKMLASSSSDETVRLWQVTDGRALQTLQMHTSDINSVAFSQDGKMLASGADDQTVRLWRVADGSLLQTLPHDGVLITSVAFSPDGQLLASGCHDDAVRLWRVADGSLLRTLQEHEDWVRSVVFSPNGKLLASGSEDHTVRLWIVADGSLQQTLRGHDDYVNSVVFSPDGKTLASGSDDQTVRLWRVADGGLQQTLQGHKDRVKSVAFSSDGKLLASGCNDHTMRLWSVTDGQTLTVLAGRFQPKTMTVLHGSEQVALGMISGLVEVWDLTRLERFASCTTRVSGNLIALDYSPATQLLASANNDASLVLYSLETQQQHQISLEVHCLRANIFNTWGLRPDQKALLLCKGAVEVNPQRLVQGSVVQDVRSFVRAERLQRLAIELLNPRATQERPLSILVIGPGTFRITDKGVDTNRILSELDDLYRGLTSEYEKEPRQLFSERERLASLGELIDRKFFQVVIDLDVFSPLTAKMFSSSAKVENYAFADIAKSPSQIERILRFADYGSVIFIKYAPERTGSKGRIGSKERSSPSRAVDALAGALLDWYRTSTVCWTGLYSQYVIEPLIFESLTQRAEKIHFYWAVDEAIRERFPSDTTTYLDYPVDQTQDFFGDLTRTLAETEYSLNTKFNPSRLQAKIHSTDAAERALAASHLLTALATGLLAPSAKLEALLSQLQNDAEHTVRYALLQTIIDEYNRLPPSVCKLVPEFTSDSDEEIRAAVGTWIINNYDEVGKEHEALLEQFALDSSTLVRQTVVDAITRRFIRLPRHIRDLASRLVGSQIEVKVITGGGMMMGEESDLVLRVTNKAQTPLEVVEVELLPSAEYSCAVPQLTLGKLAPYGSGEVQFRVCMKYARQIAISYRINGEMQDPIYVASIEDNPYNYGGPVFEAATFVGREKELDDIIQAMTKPTKQDILLVGERRTGKTSLFNQLEQRLKTPFIPVRVVLNEYEARTDAVLDAILRKIVNALVKQGILDNTWYQHSFFSPDFSDRVAEVLDAAVQKLPDIRLMLLLDEADFLLDIVKEGAALVVGNGRGTKTKPPIDERVQTVLRAAFQSSQVGNRLRVIVAGSTELSSYMLQHSSPFFNHFRFVHLKPLTVVETRSLIVKPAGVLGFLYTYDAIERIVALSGGQPYYCQALCYEAFAVAREHKKTSIGIDAVESGLQKIKSDLFQGYRSGFWERATRKERTFLAALASGKAVPAVPELQVKRLLDWQLIAKTGKPNEYRFSAALFEQWTQMTAKKR